MNRFAFAIVGPLLFAVGGDAQVVLQQSVQLPTIHSFGATTTVVVPARGTIAIGGVARSGRRRTSFDKVGTALNRTSQVGSLHMGVTIIDHAEIDRQLLAEAARLRGAKFDVLGRPVEDRDRDQAYLRGGRVARAVGQTEVAKVFYRRVPKFGNPQNRIAAKEELSEIDGDANSR